MAVDHHILIVIAELLQPFWLRELEASSIVCPEM